MEERNWSKVTSAEISLANASLRRVCCDLGHGYDGEWWVQWLAFHASSHTLPASQARTRKSIPVNVNSKSPSTHLLSIHRYQHCQRGSTGAILYLFSVERYHLPSLQCPHLPPGHTHRVASACFPRCGVHASSSPLPWNASDPVRQLP